MDTVNSLSGGKTSSYMAVHYPADHEVFSLVCIDNHNAGHRIDKKVKQMVNDRLQKYCPHMPEFLATSEDPKTLNVILDLEQMIGREIVWLRGMGWEKMADMKKAIPNMQWRFCTTILKMQPMFEYLYLYTKLPVMMRLGFRYDESERSEEVNNLFEFSDRCEYRWSSGKHVHRWQEIQWRECEFPLIENKVFHHHVRNFWEDKGIYFPLDSNCQNCFWKDPQQLRMNYETNPDIMKWAAVYESINNATFKKEMSLLEIRNLGIQMDFNFGTGAGCRAGGCTN